MAHGIEDFLTRDGSGWEEWVARLPGWLHPDIECDVAELRLPDIDPVFYGIAAVQRFWREWFAAWETLDFDYQFIDAGERVVMLLNQRIRGRSAGVEVAIIGGAGKYAHVGTFRSGLMVHWKIYADQAEALEAVGLSE